MLERKASVIKAVMLLGLIGGCHSPAAFAETVVLKAALSSLAEVPPLESAGTGQGKFTYDTVSKVLSYTVTYRGLTGSATASHVHGPAPESANADIVRTFPVPESPISGKAVLTDEQATELLGGRLYVDVHTDANTTGEVRGQIVRQ